MRRATLLSLKCLTFPCFLFLQGGSNSDLQSPYVTLQKSHLQLSFFPMISVGSQVVEAQDLELLDELYPWIERSRLDQRADAESLLCLCQRSNRQNCRVYWDIKPGRC